MLARLMKSGKDVVLTLPQEALDNLGVSEGEDVSLELDRLQRRVIISPPDQVLPHSSVDEDFACQVDEFIARYRLALEQLAK